MSAGEVWRASVQGSHSGTELAIVTWHFRMLTSADPADTIGLYLKTYWCDLIKTKMPSSFRFDQINFLRVNASPPMADIYTTGFPIAGTQGAGDQFARQTALVVKHGTAFAGRSYRGRHYIPSILDASYNATFSNTLVSAVQTYYDDIVAAVGASGANTDIRWVVWSQKLLTYTDISYAVVRNNPGVVRRRRIGTGQ